MKDYFRLLNQYKSKLTKQQYKTFKGQILSGDTKGFVKGLQKVLYGKAMINAFERMKKTVLNNIFDESLINEEGK